MLSIIRTQFSDDDKRGVCILGQDFKRNALAGSIKCTGVFEKLLITIFLLFLLILFLKLGLNVDIFLPFIDRIMNLLI